MSYIVGASFSNVQRSFNLPTYFVAVAIESAKKSILENIKTKEELQEDPEYKKNPFDSSKVEDEINRFQNAVIKSQVIKLTNKDRKKSESDLSLILDGLLKAVQSVESSDIRLATQGIETCFLHVPLDKEGKELMVEDLAYFHHPLSKYKTKFQRKGEFDKILELARLHMWFENLNNVRGKRPFINKQLTTLRDIKFFQICKLAWNSPPIESYSNGFVGYPRIVMKTGNDMKDMLLCPNSQLDIFPVAQACSGVEKGLDIPSCKRVSSREPFGHILSSEKFEKCRFCAEDVKGSFCLFQKPKCDGKEMLCKDRSFVSGVCHADFCIYVTLYNDKIKVGRSVKSRVIGRLIEQCALDGFVFFPVPWLPFADYLEEKLVGLLKGRMHDFRITEVSHITEKITSEDRFENIMLHYENAAPREKRDVVYKKIVDVLTSLDNPEAAYLSSLERRNVNLEKNWRAPNGMNLSRNNFIHDFRFKRIKGMVTAVIGSFIILNEKAYDTSKMEGYVVGVPSNETRADKC